MAHRTSLLLVLAVLLCTLAVPAAGAETYHFVTFHFPPMEYTDDGQTAAGVAVDVVRRVMQDLGEAVTITVYPWTRALQMVRRGEADAIFTAYRNAERERDLDFSNEVLFPQVVFFYARSDANIDFDGDLETVAGLRIGVVSTISYGPRFDQAKSGLLIDKARTLEHNFEKLLRRRIDLVPSNIHGAQYTLARMDADPRIVRLPQMIEQVPSYIAFSKQRRLLDLRDRFDARLAQLKAEGAYAAILERHNIQLFESQTP